MRKKIILDDKPKEIPLILDNHQITIEYNKSVIRIKDNDKNVIRLDKRDGFFILGLKGTFEFGREDLKV